MSTYTLLLTGYLATTNPSSWQGCSWMVLLDVTLGSFLCATCAIVASIPCRNNIIEHTCQFYYRNYAV